MNPTDEFNKRFPRGTRVRGIVRSHVRFGYFVNILEPKSLGLVDTTLFEPSEKEKIPEVGSEIEAVILQYRNTKVPHFRLSAHPYDFANSKPIRSI